MTETATAISLAKSLMAERRFHEAEQVILEAIGGGDDALLKGLLADLYIKTNRLDEALAQCDELLRHNPSNIYISQKRGDILVLRKKYAEALAIFMDLYERNRDDYYLLKRIAKTNYLARRLDDARSFCKTAIAKFPERHDLQYLLCQINDAAGNADEASAAIERALALDPGNSLYYSQRLSLRMKIKGLDSSSLEEMIEIADDADPQLLKLLAKKCKDEGRLEQAAEAYRKLIARENTDFNRKLLGFVYYKMKRYAEAFAIFIGMPDENFLDDIFLTSIMTAAKEPAEKKALLERLTALAVMPSYKKLWGKIKKLSASVKLSDERSVIGSNSDENT